MKTKKIIWTLIIIGLILRIGQYLANRSLWLDESTLAVNIINRTFFGLFKPLGYSQAAPIGFLLLSKICVYLFGAGEYSLRLVPLLSGILSVWLFYKVARSFLSEKETIIALLFFCFCDALVYYSSEVKQYSLDVFSSLLLYFCFIKFINGKKTRTDYIWFLIISALLIWISQPAIFIIATLILAMFLMAVKKKITWSGFIFFSLVWTVNFFLNYIFFLKPGTNNYGLQDYWASYFAPLPNSLDNISWYFQSLLGFIYYPLGLVLPIFGSLILLLGSSILFKKNKLHFILLTTPFLFALGASFFRLYPFTDRFLLFLLPAAFILVIYGLGYFFEKNNQYLSYLGGAIFLIMFLPAAIFVSYHLFFPRLREEIRPVIKYYRSHYRTGDLLYIYYGAKVPFIYYRELFHMEQTPYIVGTDRTENGNRYLEDIKRSSGHKRVWYIFSHNINNMGRDEEKFFLSIADKLGKRQDYLIRDGAAVYLYSFK